MSVRLWHVWAPQERVANFKAVMHMDNDLKEECEIYAYYWVSCFECSNQEIRQYLGLESTEIKIKGEQSRYWRSR